MEPEIAVVADYVAEGVSIAFDEDLYDEEVEEEATKSSLSFLHINRQQRTRKGDMAMASASLSDNGFASRLKHWGWIRIVNQTNEPLVVYYRPTPFRGLQSASLHVSVAGAVDVGAEFNMAELNGPYLTSSIVIGPPERGAPPQKPAGKIAVLGNTYVSIRRGAEPDPAKWHWDGTNMLARRGQVITVKGDWTEPLHQTNGIVDGAAGLA
ncbi:hypothetical protein PLESTB_000635900 [Pleodorina starrii]|uniref:Uncharacterized protein n=1 Tax=Pleodorina starrii TaxID=330485 RepID=A0A9W6BIL8_9CHLO|nr:hypothetical protein PLESTM_001297000 [Pleodorina starrii]GLC52493.1 hypothetical protein PLESTB_000635900 [Pleodorina starrii]GLC71497.1 hypothetical protein PLESTF_001128200 [Pleodorina starrii]